MCVPVLRDYLLNVHSTMAAELGLHDDIGSD